MASTKGPEVRALLLVRVHDDPKAAFARLAQLVVDQQWTPEWSVKRIDVVDLEESRKLDKFAPTRETEFHFCVAVSAKNRDILQKLAFPQIVKTLGSDSAGLTLIASLGADWSIY
jgi:hypothetical protein